MSGITGWIQENLNLSVALQLRLLLTLLLLLLLFVYRRLADRLVRRRVVDPNELYRWQKTVEYAGSVVFVLLLARIWTEQLGSVATYLGLVSAGLAIALSDLIANFAGWIFILARRPFDVGDRVEIDGVAGDVVDIRYFTFSMVEIRNWVDADQSTGRLLHVPNRKVYTATVANFTIGFPFIWHELPVLITFESDWREAKAVLQGVLDAHVSGIAAEAERKRDKSNLPPTFKFGKLTPIVYTSVEASGVLLTMRFLCNPRRRRGTSEAIWEAVLDAFAADPSLEFAYPTIRYFTARDPADRATDSLQRR